MLKNVWNKLLFSVYKGIGNNQILDELRSINISRVSGLSPVDNFIFSHYRYNNTGHFHKQYLEWRMRRIRKVIEILGIDFNGKKVLETAGGLGDIGAFFAELGAEVISLEGRASNRNFANLRYRHLKNFKSVECDLEKDFSTRGKVDLIINFGTLEIVKNIDTLMASCCALSDDIILETMVCDSSDPNKIVNVEMDPKIIDSPMGSISARPSPAYIENFFKSKGFSVHRYFDADINTPHQKYDWEHKNDNSVKECLRRFWRFTKVR